MPTITAQPVLIWL